MKKIQFILSQNSSAKKVIIITEKWKITRKKKQKNSSNKLIKYKNNLSIKITH